MTIKILAGLFKGRFIKLPKTKETRPITASLRKSLFDACQCFIEGANVLDLFAGSGAIGIEALSRGASFCTFIDIGKKAIHCIRENIKVLNLEDRSLILERDAFRFLSHYRGQPFDILFIDPPYPIGLKGYKELLTLLRPPLFQEESHIFLEMPSQIAKTLEELLPSYLVLERTKRSSTTSLFQLIVHFK